MPYPYDDWCASVLIPRLSATLQTLATTIVGQNISVSAPDTNDYTVVLTMRRAGRNLVATIVFNSDPTRPGRYSLSVTATKDGVPVDLQFAPRPWTHGDKDDGLATLTTHLDQIDAVLPTLATRIVAA